MKTRGDLSDDQWKQLEPLMPTSKVGRPPKNHRVMLNGILWILRTGAPWRDVPERYGPWQSVASRFYRWRKSGTWDRILSQLQQKGDANGHLDWSCHQVDGSVIRAHQHAAGVKKRIKLQSR